MARTALIASAKQYQSGARISDRAALSPPFGPAGAPNAVQLAAHQARRDNHIASQDTSSPERTSLPSGPICGEHDSSKRPSGRAAGIQRKSKIDKQSTSSSRQTPAKEAVAKIAEASVDAIEETMQHKQCALPMVYSANLPIRGMPHVT